MNDIYVDNRYYIDLSKVIFFEVHGIDNRNISLMFINGKTLTFFRDDEKDYKAFKYLKEWHQEKIDIKSGFKKG